MPRSQGDRAARVLAGPVADGGELDAVVATAGLVMVALGLSITRWRSALARWLMSFLAILTVLMLIGDGLPTPRSAWELFLDYSFVVDLALLWSPLMSRWLRSRPTPEPAGELLRGGGTVILLAFAIFVLMSMLGLWPI